MVHAANAEELTREVAQARMVVVNGAGYDPWMNKLIASNPDDLHARHLLGVQRIRRDPGVR